MLMEWIDTWQLKDGLFDTTSQVVIPCPRKITDVELLSHQEFGVRLYIIVPNLNSLSLIFISIISWAALDSNKYTLVKYL